MVTTLVDQIGDDKFQEALKLVCMRKYASPRKFKEYVRNQIGLKASAQISFDELRDSMSKNGKTTRDLFPLRKNLSDTDKIKAHNILYNQTPHNVPFADSDSGGVALTIALLYYACDSD